MCHRGIELRGDWALQLNHVPWCEPDCRQGGAESFGEPVAGAPEPAPPIAAPVHRFHPVPTAPVTRPQPIPAVPSSPTTADREAEPPLSASAAGDDDAPQPGSGEPVSVLKLYPEKSEPAWVFGASPAASTPRVAADRRRLSSGWQPPPPRR
jgi:hypothetical protein